MKRSIAVIALLCARLTLAQQSRIASDFEIAEMERQVTRSHDASSQLAGHLNLGDLRMARNEGRLARTEYTKTAEIAARERRDARRASDLTRYSDATAYEGLAEAKLGRESRSFGLAEEAIRYASDSPKSWNLYASTMSVLARPRKAAGAAANAVAIAAREADAAPTTANRLDLAVYEYALAGALIESGEKTEAQRLLVKAVDDLRSPQFDALRRDVARRESFEIYSAARGDAAAYLSVLNRAQLRLAAMYEEQHDVANARRRYEDVLAVRSDDATALAALARLTTSAEERERYYVAAFDANPFSMALVRDFLAHPTSADAGASVGSRMRATLAAVARGEHRAARSALDALLREFPENDTVSYLAAMNDVAMGDIERARTRPLASAALRREIADAISKGTAESPAFLRRPAPAAPLAPSAAELRQLMQRDRSGRLTSEERVALDRMTFVSTVHFTDERDAPPGQSVFAAGTIEGISFRFTEPTAFRGDFAIVNPLRLTYRILGVTDAGGADALLLEPLGLEVAR